MNLKDVIFGNSAAAVHDLGGSYSGSSQEWLPIKDILKGVIITRDKRFVKVLEFLHTFRNGTGQRNRRFRRLSEGGSRSAADQRPDSKIQSERLSEADEELFGL